VRASLLVSIACAACRFEPGGLAAGGTDGGADATLGSGSEGRRLDGPNATADAPKMDAPIVVGELTLAHANQPDTTLDFTTDGTLDWAHWTSIGGPGRGVEYDHKVSGAAVNDVTTVRTGAVIQIFNVTINEAWTDGTPTLATTTNTGIGTVTGGLQFTIAADSASTRTLKFYVGIKNATSRLDVALSDNSATAVNDTTFTATSSAVHGVYTITYRAASTGQHVTVTWSCTSNSSSTNSYVMALGETLQ